MPAQKITYRLPCGMTLIRYTPNEREAWKLEREITQTHNDNQFFLSILEGACMTMIDADPDEWKEYQKHPDRWYKASLAGTPFYE